MSIRLFLDANVLLSFYSLSNADVSQLGQLLASVKSGDVTLMINRQLVNEFQRNRETKIQEAFKALRDDKFKCAAPSFARAMPEFIELQNILVAANKQHAELIKVASGLIEEQKLDADRIVIELVNATQVSELTDAQYLAAYKRFLTGSPPGKKKSTIGDEINWEFLLSDVPNGEDLHLVTLDGDYASPMDPKKANAFLLLEWHEKKSSHLHFYKDLNDFFKLYIPKIKLANQAKLSALISELAASSSFTHTHSIIAKFPDDPEFNDAQILELMNIKTNNSQVGWIEEDPDVASFYAPIKVRYAQIKPTVVEATGSA